MDSRIPPDAPRRAASLPYMHPMQQRPNDEAPVDAPGLDAVELARQPSPPQALQTARFVSPPLVAALAHAHAIEPPLPAQTAVQQALHLLSRLRGNSIIAHINESARLAVHNRLAASTLHNLSPQMREELVELARNDLIVDLLDDLSQVSIAATQPAQSPELKAVQIAFEDVPAWYQSLDLAKTESVRVSREDDYNCPISRKIFSEIEHPVALRATTQVVHVFEAADLLQWMLTSLQTPANQGAATNPVDRQPFHLQQICRARNVFFAPVGPPRG